MGLFSTTHHHHKVEAVAYEKKVTINEYKAPTDDSIRIFKELEQKAKDSVITSFRVENNVIKADVVVVQENLQQDSLRFVVKFKVNGNEYLVEEVIDRYEWKTEYMEKFHGFGNERIFRSVYQKFSELITMELMKQSPDFVNSLKTEK